MPVPLIPCRHKNDPALTHDVPETALGHFPDWEPITPAGEASETPAAQPKDEAADKTQAAGAGRKTGDNKT
jgi:hypothetical protein